MVSKLFVFLNDAEDDKICEIEKCACWVKNNVVRLQGTFISQKLHVTWVHL